MDPFHARLARVSLSVADRYGFCLAGGYAVQAHGFIERRSEDIDLFTTMAAEREFPDAVQIVAAALRADGLEVVVQRNGPTFARLAVTEPGDGASARVELGVDWRAFPPALLEIGPVLHADDAVANKLCALFGRAEVRDYVDVDGIVRSGRYTLPALIRLATEHDPGFDVGIFAQALTAVERLADSAFEAYGMSSTEGAALKKRIVRYAEQIRTGEAGMGTDQ
jgi:hypothetical protein